MGNEQGEEEEEGTGISGWWAHSRLQLLQLQQLQEEEGIKVVVWEQHFHRQQLRPSLITPSNKEFLIIFMGKNECIILHAFLSFFSLCLLQTHTDTHIQTPHKHMRRAGESSRHVHCQLMQTPAPHSSLNYIYIYSKLSVRSPCFSFMYIYDLWM